MSTIVFEYSLEAPKDKDSACLECALAVNRFLCRDRSMCKLADNKVIKQ